MRDLITTSKNTRELTLTRRKMYLSVTNKNMRDFTATGKKMKDLTISRRKILDLTAAKKLVVPVKIVL